MEAGPEEEEEITYDWYIIFSNCCKDRGVKYRWLIRPDTEHHYFDLILLDLSWISSSWLGLSCCGVFLSFKCLSKEFCSMEEVCISFHILVLFSGFLQNICRLVIPTPSISSLKNYQLLIMNKKVQTQQAKTVYNELIIRY